MVKTSTAVAVGAAAFLVLLMAALGADPAFRAHAWIVFVALSLATVILLRQSQAVPAQALASARSGSERYMDGVVRYGVIATMFWAVAGHGRRLLSAGRSHRSGNPVGE